MCTGAEIALIGLAAVGTAVSAGAAISGGQAQASQAEAQAEILKQQARRERQVAALEETEFRKRQARDMARRRALLGGAGIDPSSGSPLLASEDFAREIELQALKIRSGGQVSATRLQQQASLYRGQAGDLRTAGYIRGGALLFQGAADIAGGNYTWGTPGVDVYPTTPAYRTGPGGRLAGPV